MEPTSNPTQDIQSIDLVRKKLMLESQIKGGINWFYWISGLTVINSIILFLGGKIHFIVGLGISQLLDALSIHFSKSISDPTLGVIIPFIAILIDVLLAGVFFLLGFLGNKRIRPVVLAGIILYGLDTVLMLVFTDWLGLAFHGLALFFLWSGYQSIGRLNALEKNGVIEIPKTAVLRPAPPAPKRKPSRLGCCALYVLLLAMGLTLTPVATFTGITSIYDEVSLNGGAARTTATIVDTRTGSDSGTPTYEVRYQFTVEKDGTVYSFSDRSGRHDLWARITVDQWREIQAEPRAEVEYLPGNPWVNRLVHQYPELRLGDDAMMIVLGLTPWILIIFMRWVQIRSNRSAQSESAAPPGAGRA